MVTRTVTGKLYTAEDKPWVGAEVRFELARNSFAGDRQYPKSTIKVSTQQDGTFEVPLWVNEAGMAATHYRCQFPSGELFDISVPPGAWPIDVATLRSLGVVAQEPSITAQLMAIIQAHDASADAHPSLLAHLAELHRDVNEVDRSLAEIVEVLRESLSAGDREVIDRLLKLVERLKQKTENWNNASRNVGSD